MAQNLLELFGKIVLLGSGAIGTNLRTDDESYRSLPELMNQRHPERVLALHQGYREAGSQFLVTNTFAANSVLLQEAGVAAQCKDLNRAGVRLAREAAGNPCLVVGSMGPLSLGLRLDDYTDHDLETIYKEQSDALSDADTLILETFMHPREAKAALKAAASTGLPFIFQSGNLGTGRDRWNRIDELVSLALEAGAAAVGTNCRHPNEIVEVASYLLGCTDLPVTASPNAGQPIIDRGVIRYECSPEDLMKIGEKLVDIGVSVVGGCCGTTEAHIKSLASIVLDRPVSARQTIDIVRSKPLPETRPEAEAGNRIRDLIRADRLVVSVEIRADRKSGVEKIVAGAEEIADAGADMFDVPDNPAATVGRDAMVVAARLQAMLHVPSFPHKAVIQSNLLQIHSTLISFRDVDLHGVLVITGDSPAMGHLGGMAKISADMKSSVEMLRLIRLLREGKMINGEEVGDPPDLCAGCSVQNASKPQLRWLQKKIEAGAEFVFSQPVFSYDQFRELRDSLADIPIRLFPGIMPLISRRSAEVLAGGAVPGIKVPHDVCAEFGKYDTKEDQKRLGMDRTMELGLKIAEEAQSIYLIMPFGTSCYRDTAQIVRSIKKT